MQPNKRLHFPFGQLVASKLENFIQTDTTSISLVF
jgi:hypothetical protein